MKMVLEIDKGLLSKIADISSDILVGIDDEDYIVVWNRLAERIFGYSKNEAIGRKVGNLGILFAENADRLRASARDNEKANLEAYEFICEQSGSCNNGREYAVKWTLIPHLVKTKCLIVGIGQEIKALRHSESIRNRKTVSESRVSEASIESKYNLTQAKNKKNTDKDDFLDNKIESVLYDIAETFGSVKGELFFNAITRYLTDRLNMAVAIIGRLVLPEGKSVRTVAVTNEDGVMENFEYDLTGTPCENVIGKNLCCIPRNVQALFPDDILLQNMSIQSYVGIPLNDSHGKPIGILVLLDRKPIENEDIVLAIVKLFASRTAAELEHVIANEALQENEALLRTIAENYPNSYLSIIEEDLTIGYTSGQELKKQNLNPDQFVGSKLEDVFGDQTPLVREHYLKTFAGNQQSFELDINNQHQLYRTVPLVAKDGSIPRILAVVENITERRHAESQLTLLNFALDNMHEAAFLVNEDAGFSYVNEEVCRMLGYSREDLLHLKVPDIDPNTDNEWWREHWNSLREKGKVTIETIHHAKDGTSIPVEISANYIEHAGHAYNLAIARDISERKLLESERQTQLRFMESMDLINRAIQRTNDFEQMMRNVLDTVLLVFDCDRAWLVYPCDPEAATWNVPMERTKPEYPGASAINLEVSMEATIAQVFRAVLSSNGPVKFGPGSKHPLPIMPADRFAVLSQIATAIYPKGDKPYCFGLHQCSHSRIWTGAEEMLLQEIARRLADSLSSLLAYRNLQESEEKYRTLIQNIQAAVVVHNSDTQISTSNAAAQELLGLTEDQMLGKTAWDPDWHFYREDGTVMPFEEYPANQVVATRKSLRDLIVGIHRPGNIQDVWVLASADPVFGADNEISRVIVTFMDITERKRVEERIQREVARTSVLLEIYEQAPKLSDKELYDFTLERAVQLTGSKIGFFHLVSEDQEQIILTSWNSEALKNCTAIYDTHYPLGQAGNWVDCVRYQRPVIYNDFPNSPHQKGLPEGHSPVRRFMSIPVMEDDKVRYIFGVGNKTEEYEDHDLDQILLVAYELSKILKQRRTEETLRKSEAELKEAQRVAQLGNWEWNVLTDTIKWSEECYRLCGFDPHQPVPGYEEHLKVYTPESMSKLDTAVKKALETGEPYELDLEIAHPVNNTQWIVARGRIIRDANGKIVGLGGTVQNITVRKRAEAEIARMNRALRMLSDSNQTLIRTTDEAALLDEVCKIAIETGGYRLAWIGIAEHDEAKNLRPVAHAGVDSGYIETAKISWDEESPRGKGPGGSAIRSGQPCIVRNIFSDPSFTPWRDEAIQRGYQSIIALPLISGSITYGAFGIYADQPDAFDEMEVEILKELAGDVAYGIGALRIRGEQKRAKQLLQESETRYRVVADNTYDWEFWINPAGMFNYVSPSVERITGYTVQEFMEDPDLYFRILHPEDQGSRRAHRDSVLQNPCPHSNEHEFRILHKDGSLRWIGHVCAPVYDQDGTFIGIRGSQRDITERKLMESALIQRDTEMGAIHDYAPVMMCMLDDERNLIRANRALEEFIEKPISESQREQGFGLLGCIHSSDHPKGCGFGLHCSDCPVNYALKETLDTGKSFRGLEWEFTLKRTGRTERFVFSISCSLFVLGTEKRLLLYVQDITKMTDAVEQLRRLNAHIDSVLEADRKWVAQEIHDDLGQQLTAMKMDIALARKRIPKDSAALSEKLDSMEKLTDSALESARKIAKRIRPIPLEIMDFTTALEWLANEISEHSEISCSLDIDTGDHTFSTKQSTILYRILQESLTNVVRHAEASHVDISLHIERGTLILRILDDGKGIDLEKANTYSSMGLTGMRERARFLGGDVSIKPLSQGGTVVNVQIPLTESEVSRD